MSAVEWAVPLALIAGLAGFAAWSFWIAPLGYEDERGFHLGEPDDGPDDGEDA